MRIQRLGWIPDLPDHRDYLAKPVPFTVEIPRKVDLTSFFSACYDQLQIGSCTSNSIAGILEFNQRKQGEKDSCTPSRLFIYYCERLMEHSVSQDAGAQIRDGIKCVVSEGAPPETLWPYIDNGKAFKTKPNKAAYAAALKHEALVYERVQQNLSQMKAVLASGFPFACGFTVYEEFESEAVAKSGIVPMPGKKSRVDGGHAVVCVGYDDAVQRFRMRNSWGTDWGQNGYFEMPYAYLSNPNLADDFWVIRKVE